MLPYQRKNARAAAESLLDLGYFDELGLTVNHVCCTSVDDARYTIDACTRIAVLEACRAYESAHEGRKTLLSRINSRIKKLQKEQNKQ